MYPTAKQPRRGTPGCLAARSGASIRRVRGRRPRRPRWTDRAAPGGPRRPRWAGMPVAQHRCNRPGNRHNRAQHRCCTSRRRARAQRLLRGPAQRPLRGLRRLRSLLRQRRVGARASVHNNSWADSGPYPAGGRDRYARAHERPGGVGYRAGRGRRAQRLRGLRSPRRHRQRQVVGRLVVGSSTISRLRR